MAKAKRKQLEIPGAERETIAEIDELAGPYIETQHKRQDLQDQENQLREQLSARMESLGVDKYTYDDGEDRFLVTRDSVVKLRFKRVKDDSVPAAG